MAAQATLAHRTGHGDEPRDIDDPGAALVSSCAGPTMTVAGPEPGRHHRYVRASDVLWRRTAATVVLLAAGDDEVVELAGTAVALWETLVEPASVEEVTAQLAAQFGVTAGVVAGDVASAVGDLVRRGVLDVVGDG